MSSISETSVWIKFFTEAGIPAGDATNYAILFTDNRIKQNMLMDLNRDYLRDMGISVMGDIIAILKQAKAATAQLSRQRVIADHDLDKVFKAAEPSTAKKSTPAGRMLDHYVRKDPPSGMTGRLGGAAGTAGGKRSSVFNRLGDNSVSSTTDDGSSSVVSTKVNELEYHGVLKYSTEETNERVRELNISRIAKADTTTTITARTIDNSGVKSRLGSQSSASSHQSAGIFAKERESALTKVAESKTMTKSQSVKRLRDDNNGLENRISNVKSLSSVSLRTRRVVTAVRRVPVASYLDRTLNQSEGSSEDDTQRPGNQTYMDRVEQPIKISILKGYGEERRPIRKVSAKTYMDREPLPRKLVVSKPYVVADTVPRRVIPAPYQDREIKPTKKYKATYYTDDEPQVAPRYSSDEDRMICKQSSGAHMDTISKPIKLKDYLGERNSRREVPSKASTNSELRPLKVSISQNKHNDDNYLKRTAASKVTTRQSSEVHTYDRGDSDSDGSTSSRADNSYHSDSGVSEDSGPVAKKKMMMMMKKVVPRSTPMDTSSSDERESSRDDIDEYLPALPATFAQRLLAQPKKTYYKKIVKINKKTGEIISEEKQLLKGGVFCRLSL